MQRELASIRGGAALLAREGWDGDQALVLDAALRARHRCILVATHPAQAGASRTDERGPGGAEWRARDALVAGMVACRSAGSYGRIEALYVAAQQRRHGAAGALFDAALAWLAAQGCREADAVALPGDRAAKSFYESRAWKARAVVMSGSVAPR